MSRGADGGASASELEAIGRGLTDFNTADVGPADRIALAVLVRNPTGTKSWAAFPAIPPGVGFTCNGLAG